MNRLEGKSAVVTGSSRGIGRAIALRFAAGVIPITAWEAAAAVLGRRGREDDFILHGHRLKRGSSELELPETLRDAL